MVEPTTLSLEAFILVAAAGSLALSAVLAIWLVSPRGRSPRFGATGRSKRGRVVGPLGPTALVIASATIVVGLLLRPLPVRIGSSSEVDLALLAGAIGGFAVAGIALGVARLLPSPLADETLPTATRRPSRRGWIAAAAIASGAGGTGLLTLIALYLQLGGHVSAMLAAPLGGAIAAIATRAPRASLRGADPDEQLSFDELLRRDSLARSSMVRGVDLYLAFLFAGVGGALLAFVPSEVRTLHPNAVLFPIVALAAVFVASVGAALFGASADLPARSVRWVTALALAALSCVALLAVVPAYLDGSSALLASAITGPAAAAFVLLLGDGYSTPRTSVRAATRYLAPIIGLAFLLLVAYRLGSGAWSGGGGATDPSLGAYGLGLASVALTGCLGGLCLLDLGERLSAPAFVASAPSTAARPVSDPAEFGAPVVGLAAVLGSLVLLLGALALVPLEIGLAPSDFVAAANPGAIGLLVGLVLGLLLVAGAIGLSQTPTEEDRGPSTAAESGPASYLEAAASVGAAIAAPLCVAWGLGAPGLLGFAIGSSLTILGLSGLRQLGPVGRSHGNDLAIPMLMLIVVTAVVFAGAILGTSLGGHL